MFYNILHFIAYYLALTQLGVILLVKLSNLVSRKFNPPLGGVPLIWGPINLGSHAKMPPLSVALITVSNPFVLRNHANTK